MSPLKGATRRSKGPFGTLPRGALCSLTRGQAVSFFPSVSPSAPHPHSSSSSPYARGTLSVFFENSFGIREGTRPPRPRNPSASELQPARNPFQRLHAWRKSIPEVCLRNRYFMFHVAVALQVERIPRRWCSYL